MFNSKSIKALQRRVNRLEESLDALTGCVEGLTTLQAKSASDVRALAKIQVDEAVQIDAVASRVNRVVEVLRPRFPAIEPVPLVAPAEGLEAVE